MGKASRSKQERNSDGGSQGKERAYRKRVQREAARLMKLSEGFTAVEDHVLVPGSEVDELMTLNALTEDLRTTSDSEKLDFYSDVFLVDGFASVFDALMVNGRTPVPTLHKLMRSPVVLDLARSRTYNFEARLERLVRHPTWLDAEWTYEMASDRAKATAVLCGGSIVTAIEHQAHDPQSDEFLGYMWDLLMKVTGEPRTELVHAGYHVAFNEDARTETLERFEEFATPDGPDEEDLKQLADQYRSHLERDYGYHLFLDRAEKFCEDDYEDAMGVLAGELERSQSAIRLSTTWRFHQETYSAKPNELIYEALLRNSHTPQEVRDEAEVESMLLEAWEG